MNPTHSTIDQIFSEALRHPEGPERTAYLDEACGGNRELRERVVRLLKAHHDASSFLESPVVTAPTTITVDPPVSVGAGMTIGPYKLVERIGEGGMGAVWMAQQTAPVKRLVAIKLIKAGMNSGQIVARFEAERQALALMEHPNIARVLDAGTTDSGQPYFVMDLVKGVPITKYCDEHHLTPRERLELFIPVCQAVQHAHQKGIIHRDLKPSNVLVALYDGRPVPKVIDFGVAKAAGPQLTEHTLVTGFGAVVGTPEYMSPEQAEFNNQDIDTRSDIYALGVLLYELLTGTPPFTCKELKHAGMMEILRVIREQEPSKPSTKLSSAEGLPALAANRGTEPKQLTALVRGELDWIVMKALEKDRTRRYETANGFARDIQRYLTDDPVEACPPNAGYRLKKFVRRNRVVITTATLVALALVLGTIVSTWQAFRAEAARSEAQTQRELAEANFQKARQAVDEYFTIVSESKLLDVPGMQPLRKELLEAALRYYQAMRNERADDPAVLADLVVAQLHVTNIYHELDRNDDSVAALESAVALAERLRHDYPLAVEQHRRLAGYWKVERRGASNTMPKDPLAARRTLTKFLQLWEAFARENPAVDAFQNDVAAINMLLAAVEGGVGAANEPPLSITRAVDYNKTAAAIWEQLSHAQPDVPAYRENLARVYVALADEFRLAGQTNPAREATAKALTLEDKLIAQYPDVPTYRELAARKLVEVATGLADTRPAETDAAFRQALQAWQKLAADFPAAHEYTSEFARAQFTYAKALAGPLKRPSDAIQVSREANESLRKLAAEFPDQPRYLKELAFNPCDLAKRLTTYKAYLGEAERLHLQSLAAFNQLAKQFPKNPSNAERAGHSYRYLGWIARDTGRPNDAVAYFEKGIAAFQKLAEADIPQKDGYYRDYEADTLQQLAVVLAADRQMHEAEKVHLQALAAFNQLAKQFPKNPSYVEHVGHSYRYLGWIARDTNRLDDAVAYFEKGITAFQKLAADIPEKVGYYREYQAGTLKELALVLATGGHVQEAAAAAEKAARLAPNDFAIHEYLLDVLTRIGDKGHTLDVLRGNVAAMPTSAMAHHHLAVVLQRQGQNDEAIAEFQKTSELQPGWEWPHQCIANIDAALGRWEKAANEYTQVIRLKPDHKEAWSGRALADFHRQQWDNAVSDFTKAIFLAPQVRANWLYRGQAYLNLAQWDKAAANFAKVVDQWPNDPEGWYWHGVAYAQLNEPDKAVAELRQAIAKGFKDQDRIKNDPKLAPLRSNDDFKKLLATLEKQKQ
jgi:serine/threonine protein kinase/tetratricopeptide (TPR) repeat protein